MIDPISAVQPLASAEALEPMAAGAAPRLSSGKAFQSALETAIESVQASQEDASRAVGALMEGKGGELHSALLSTQRAELQFQLFLQLRNKVVNAYQEVMRVQL